MAKPRHCRMNPTIASFYHITSRCVRRAFLCGDDHLTGKNYEHRRQRIEELMFNALDVFATTCSSYAIMSNHYHMVLQIHPDRVEKLSDLEVCVRWHQIYEGSELTRCFAEGKDLSVDQLESLSKIVAEWRERLSSISWFMRYINENVAKEANKEDGCTGRFWEGRFKSQPLKTDASLLACMVYVDLNPIRANMAKTLEDSDHTSIQDRIKAIQGDEPSIEKTNKLAPFYPCDHKDNIIPFDGYRVPYSLSSYIHLVEASGRMIKANKKGYIEPSIDNILGRFQVSQEEWGNMCKNFEKQYRLFNYAGDETIHGEILPDRHQRR